MNKLKKNRISYIDAIRVFSILCIILIHSTAYVNDIYGNTKSVIILGNFGRFSVSLFVFLSGFCLVLKYLTQPLNTKKFITDSLCKMLPAYFVWNLIYQVHYRGSISFNLLGLKGLLLGNFSSHLYFVPVLIGLYLIFPFIWKHKDKINYFLIAAFIIQIYSQVLRFKAFALEMLIAKDARAFFPLFIGYFVLGIFCAINFNKFEIILSKYSFIFILTVLLSFILNYIHPNEITYQLYYLLSIPAVFIIFKNISAPFYSKLAKPGYYIYLIHYLLLEYLSYYFQITIISPFILSILFTLVTYALSYSFSIIYIKFKILIIKIFHLPIN